MIELTDLGGAVRGFNAGTIAEIRRIPDTMLVLLNGRTLLVRESVDEVLDRIDFFYATHAESTSSAIWHKAA